MFNSVSITRRSAKSGEAVVPVVGQFQGEGLDDSSAGVDSAGWAAWAAGQGEATGDTGRIVNVFTDDDTAGRVLIAGLGSRADFAPGRLRTVAGELGRFASRAKLGRLELMLHHALDTREPGVDHHRAGVALGEGLGLVSWDRRAFRGTATTFDGFPDLTVGCDDAPMLEGLERGLAMAEGANLARTISETPPNICTPAWIAAEAKRMARGTDLKVTVMQGRQLEEERFTGLINVGKASENAPCMVRIEWPGTGRVKQAASGRSKKAAARGPKPLVLVGKTMTYDSGGLSLKVNNGMRGMKRDKDGGCAVLGAMHLIATVLRPRRPVVALLCCAENSISDEAYRPDDVITFRNGVTVEVTNTDAEGRLVLADGLCWACEQENPAAIVDVATLTGGVVVALGSTFAGFWCEDELLRDKLLSAADRTGEALWRLPMHAEYRDMMKSKVADIVNSAPVREAHPIQGAAFLSYFLQDGIPWAHIDIAGVHSTDSTKGPYEAGPTGYGARLLAELAASF